MTERTQRLLQKFDSSKTVKENATLLKVTKQVLYRLVTWHKVPFKREGK